MGRFEILTFPERCTGCFRCELACSELYTGAFNPAKAYIQVILNEVDCTVRFTEQCNECGVCADHCLYDALKKVPREKER